MSRPAGGPIEGKLARRIRLVLFDVDGVLTDGGVYMATVEGAFHEAKRFDITDGLGLKLLKRAGLEVVLVSGRYSPATDARARELGIECHQDDGAHKLPAVRNVMERLGVGWDEVAMLADDLPDIAVLRLVGLKAAVANAMPMVAEMADWRATREGGHGAAREFCDALLAARGDLERVLEEYVAERSGD